MDAAVEQLKKLKLELDTVVKARALQQQSHRRTRRALTTARGARRSAQAAVEESQRETRERRAPPRVRHKRSLRRRRGVR